MNTQASVQENKEVPVTIVGGGPVGMTLALLLARHGVAARVVERRTTTTDHPKARGLWVRTMELFRQWGIEDEVRERGLPDNADSFVALRSMAEPELARSRPEPNLGQSPSRKSIVAQDAVEEALFKRVHAQPLVDQRLGTEFTGLTDTGEHVEVSVREPASGREERWRSSYVVGADGGGGPTAKAAGIDMVGPPVMALMLNTYWRADLSQFEAARNAAAFFFIPKEAAAPLALMANTNGKDRWLLLTRIGQAKDERPRPLTQDETIRRIREIVGLPDLQVEIINEAVWRMTRQIATTFRKGRVLLAGDAAHRFPPSGGFGMNSGIQDAHNLAWKLAFVLRGQAGDKLLDSYDLERRPAADSNADFSMTNTMRAPFLEAAARSGNLDRLQFWLRDAENHLHSAGQSLGGYYDNGALISDGTTPPSKDARVYTPTDRPGSRFPHAWIDAEKTRSTLDLFDRDFVLVAGPDAEGWIAAAATVSAKRGIAIPTHRLARADPELGFGMGPRGAVLVRPDGISAWRVGWLAADPVAELDAALGKILQ